MSDDAFHDRLLAIVLRLPGAYEDRPWGSVHCKVAGKIFVGWGRNEQGIMGMGFRTNKDLQAMLVDSDPRFTVAKYVGKYGGTDMVLGPKPDWAGEVRFNVESYRILAPKKLVKELDALDKGGSSAPSAKKPGAKKGVTSKAVPKPTTKKSPARKVKA